jgi:hypothetical protein
LEIFGDVWSVSIFRYGLLGLLRWKGIVEITKMGDYKIKMEAATSAILRLDICHTKHRFKPVARTQEPRHPKNQALLLQRSAK